MINLSRMNQAIWSAVSLCGLTALLAGCGLPPLFEEIKFPANYEMKDTKNKNVTAIWFVLRRNKHAGAYRTDSLRWCNKRSSFIPPLSENDVADWVSIYQRFRAENPLLSKALQNIEIIPLLEKWYTPVFTDALKGHGFNVVHTQELLSNENIEFSPYGVTKDEARYRLSGFAKKRNLDYIFTLTVRCFGATQPDKLAQPVGVTYAAGSLVDGSTNQLIWQYPILVEEPVAGEWDQPPDYPNLRKAIEKSLEKAIRQIHASFFKGTP